MLISVLVYLCAAVVSVPVARRLGLGSVLGYLLAGLVIGPSVLSVVGDQTSVMHFAEFGVVMMLFLIGLELRPARLWQLRKAVFGLGAIQVVFTSFLLFGVLTLVLTALWQTSLTIALACSLSSTAIVLQSLSERDLLKSSIGERVFSVLLFQDIAVIPILALLPLLTLGQVGGVAPVYHADDISWLSHQAGYIKAGVSVAAIAAIIMGGRILAHPIFGYVAHARMREVFTALSLLIVVAIEALMNWIGLSPALGAFLGGVVLADNDFRHEIEADIAPFKSLLLGVFFISVGAGINLHQLMVQPGFILTAVGVLIFVKGVILYGLARVFKFPKTDRRLFAVALAQGGEFAFVVFGLASQLGIISLEISSRANLIVALSMLVSPLLLMIYDRFFDVPTALVHREADTIDVQGEVIIVGYGRFGQIVGRLLFAQGYSLTILDHRPGQIDLLRRFGSQAFYGDAARVELLESAGAATAKLLVVAVDDQDKSLEVIETAQAHFPHLKILARAIDRVHVYQLMRYDLAGFRRETFDSAITLGIQALKLLGNSDRLAKRTAKRFTEHDEESLRLLSDLWGNDERYGLAVRERVEDLKQVLLADREAYEDELKENS